MSGAGLKQQGGISQGKQLWLSWARTNSGGDLVLVLVTNRSSSPVQTSSWLGILSLVIEPSIAKLTLRLSLQVLFPDSCVRLFVHCRPVVSHLCQNLGSPLRQLRRFQLGLPSPTGPCPLSVTHWYRGSSCPATRCVCKCASSHHLPRCSSCWRQLALRYFLFIKVLIVTYLRGVRGKPCTDNKCAMFIGAFWHRQALCCGCLVHIKGPPRSLFPLSFGSALQAAAHTGFHFHCCHAPCL